MKWNHGFAVMLVVLMSSQAWAWSTEVCRNAPEYRLSYPNNQVWPLWLARNMPEGDWSRIAFEDAIGQWNSIYGALDVLSVGGDGYAYCEPPFDAGFGVVSWDDGTCFDWQANGSGVNVKWWSGCQITRSLIYFNTDLPWTAEFLRSTAAHELGHYVHYAHNWNEVSIMGYTWWGMHPGFLTSRDQDYLRTVFQSENVAGPDLAVHRYVLASPVVPDSLSYELAPDTQSSGDWWNPRAGDVLRTTITGENAGGSDAVQVALHMYLEGETSTVRIGAWTIDRFAAGGQATWELEATVPSGLEPGRYEVVFWIDPFNDIAETGGPSAPNFVSTGFLDIAIPTGWTCDPAYWNTADGCDCECGAHDPDCDWDQAIFNCPDVADNHCVRMACFDGMCAAETLAPNDPEVCDGIDNDCDGLTDRYPYNGAPLEADCYDGPWPTEGVGACVGGRSTCQDGSYGACIGEILPQAESCDEVDNDCDGVVDEGVRNACGYCGPVPVEVCNGLDDDCDNVVDEGVTNACGRCGAVPVEECNGVDDDCDGSVDEGVANACGRCGKLPEETCNGVDDDCDGVTDEGVTNACGRCGEVPVETCNGVDDDCDGVTDEGVTNACGRCGEVPTETCNGVDDDCDGVTDEGVTNVCGRCGEVPNETCNGVDDDCDGAIDEQGCTPDETGPDVGGDAGGAMGSSSTNADTGCAGGGAEGFVMSLVALVVVMWRRRTWRVPEK